MSETISAERWDRDRRSLNDFYPGSRWVSRTRRIGDGYWVVPISIKPPKTEVSPVIADLLTGRNIGFDDGGKLRHSSNCEIDHAPVSNHLIQHFESIDDSYEVKVWYRGPLSDPKAQVFGTDWPVAAARNHKHLNPDGTACALFPPDDDWNPERDHLASMVDHVAIWVFKSECWIANGALPDGYGWPGPDQSHSPSDLIKISSSARCQCGSEKTFGECCRQIVVNMLLAERAVNRGNDFDQRIGNTDQQFQFELRKQRRPRSVADRKRK